MRGRLSGILLLLGWASLGQAEDLVFAQNWPQTQGPPNWDLTMFRTNQRVITHKTVTPTATTDAACQERITTAGETYDATIHTCATMPCPGPGAYIFVLQVIEGRTHESPLFVGLDPSCRTISYDEALQDSLPDDPVPQPVPPAETPPAAAIPPPSPVSVTPPAQTPPATPPLPSPRPLPTRPVTTHPQPRPAVPPGASQPGVNLIPAPTADKPWRSGSFGDTQTQVGLDAQTQRNGHPVQQLTGRGDYFAQTSTPAVAVEAGRTYDVSAQVKLQDITEFVALHVFWRDASGASIAWEEAVGGRQKGTLDWTQLQGDVTAPPGAATAHVQVRVKSRGGTAWVDDVALRAQAQTPIGSLVPPRKIEVTPAPPLLPAQPAAPAPLPPPVPAQTREALLEQFNVLKHDYQAAERAIRATYAATLDRLAQDRTAAAQQQREQAYAQGTQALQALYQTLVGHWDTLMNHWGGAL